MSRKIIGVTVGTPIGPRQIEQKINPVKTVNGVVPDKNGNVEVVGNVDKEEIVAAVIAALPVYDGEVVTE